MTVATTTNKTIGTGNGVSTTFPFTFATLPTGDLVVSLFDTSGTEIPQVENTDYTVLGEGADDGGAVVFVIAPPNQYTVLIRRVIPVLQPTDLKNQGSYYPRTVERMSDRSTMIDQQQDERITAAITLPPQVVGVSTQLPSPIPNTLFGWDSGGTAISNFPLSDIATNIAYGDKSFQTFLGTGAQTDFILSQDPGSLGNLDVAIDGVTQVNGADFNYAGTTLTFGVAPANGAVVLVRFDQAVPVGVGLASAINFTQLGAGAITRSTQDKLREFVSVTDFGAIGDGVSNATSAFISATAVGVPVYVPYTTSFYSVTSLTDAQLELLWGPGVVKVAGTVTPVASSPTFGSDDLPGVTVVKPALTPAQYPGLAASIGNAAASYDITRTGGFGAYGSILNRLQVTAAVPAGQFDVGDTTWATGTNLTGGQLFASWSGANTPAANLGETYSGGAVVGLEVNVGNRWGNFGLQLDVGGTRYTTGIQLAPDVLPAKDGVNTIAVTSISIASPGVVTLNSHGFIADMGIVFDGAGTLPTGLTKGVCYFVSQTGLTANTFQVAASVGGASINTTGSFAGPITVLPSWASSFGMVTGPSVWGHQWWIGHLTRSNTIVAGGYNRLDYGGSGAGSAPGAWSKLVGFWNKGLDMSACAFATHMIDLAGASSSTGYAINFEFNESYANTATAGSIPLPANCNGFLVLGMNGGAIKIPIYQN